MQRTHTNGQLTLCIHSPNDGGTAPARAVFLPVRDLGYTLAIDEPPTLRLWCLRVLDRIAGILHF